MTDIEEITGLEECRRVAMLAADMATLDALFDADLAYTHSNAVMERKAEYLERIASGHYDYRALSFLDLDVRVSDDTALITGRMTGDVVIAGQARKLNSQTTVVWLRRAGSWRLLAFQSTPYPMS